MACRARVQHLQRAGQLHAQAGCAVQPAVGRGQGRVALGRLEGLLCQLRVQAAAEVHHHANRVLRRSSRSLFVQCFTI